MNQVTEIEFDATLDALFAGAGDADPGPQFEAAVIARVTQMAARRRLYLSLAVSAGFVAALVSVFASAEQIRTWLRAASDIDFSIAFQFDGALAVSLASVVLIAAVMGLALHVEEI